MMLNFMAPASAISRYRFSGLIPRVVASGKRFSTIDCELKYRPFAVELRDAEGSNASRNLRKGIPYYVNT